MKKKKTKEREREKERGHQEQKKKKTQNAMFIVSFAPLPMCIGMNLSAFFLFVFFKLGCISVDTRG